MIKEKKKKVTIKKKFDQLLQNKVHVTLKTMLLIIHYNASRIIIKQKPQKSEFLFCVQDGSTVMNGM